MPISVSDEPPGWPSSARRWPFGNANWRDPRPNHSTRDPMRRPLEPGWQGIGWMPSERREETNWRPEPRRERRHGKDAFLFSLLPFMAPLRNVYSQSWLSEGSEMKPAFWRRPSEWLDYFLRDLRYAARSL